MKKFVFLSTLAAFIFGCQTIRQRENEALRTSELTRSPASVMTGVYAAGPQSCGEGDMMFPALKIGMKKGMCAGIVAVDKDGLKLPRNILQLPGRNLFVVTDFGSFDGKTDGRVLLLNPLKAPGTRISTLFSGLNGPFALRVGHDGKIYVGAVDGIFRFDSEKEKPVKEWILRNVPGRNVAGMDNAHPFHQFVFDAQGNIYVNIGSPHDSCATTPNAGECKFASGANANAAIWKYTAPAGGVFKTLAANEKSPAFQVYANGLRNSMGMAVHPQFPEEGYAFLQAENGRDLFDEEHPYEELNVIKPGRHYGFPYCYDQNRESGEFAAFLKKTGPLQNICSNDAVYERPAGYLPPHSSPLALEYYRGPMFPDLQGKVLVSLHGHRPTGGRIVAFEVDDHGIPVANPRPATYRVNCDPTPERTYVDEKGKPLLSAAHEDVIGDWYRVNGVRPKGSPVGLTVAEDGAIWIVEDKNKSILRAARASSKYVAAETYECPRRDPSEVEALIKSNWANLQQRERLQDLRHGYFEKHCTSCHHGFGLKPEWSEEQKDKGLLRYLLTEDGWVFPGDPDASSVHRRVRGIGGQSLMPLGADPAVLRRDVRYNQMMKTLETFIANLVDGQRMKVIDGGSAVENGGAVALIWSGAGKLKCGMVYTGGVVVVLEKESSARPGYSKVYRPADNYLNGNCQDKDGYYIASSRLKPI